MPASEPVLLSRNVEAAWPGSKGRGWTFHLPSVAQVRAVLMRARTVSVWSGEIDFSWAGNRMSSLGLCGCPLGSLSSLRVGLGGWALRWRAIVEEWRGLFCTQTEFLCQALLGTECHHAVSAAQEWCQPLAKHIAVVKNHSISHFNQKHFIWSLDLKISKI